MAGPGTEFLGSLALKRLLRTAPFFVVVSGLLLGACRQDRAPPGTVTTSASPPSSQRTGPVARARAADGGVGSIQGIVTLTGEPPLAQGVKRGSDPACEHAPVNDEQVIVQNGRIANVFVQLLDADGTSVPSQPVIVD